MKFRIASLALALIPAFTLYAQTVPSTLNYQGRLTDNGPTPAPVTATVNMQFAIYDAASGGTVQWQEPAGVGTTPVSVTGGIFSVLLGNSGVPVPATVFTGGAARWLQITANGEVLTPRQKLAANGWANQAEKSDDSTKLGGIAAAGYQLVTVQGCVGGQFLNAIGNGTANCASAQSGLTAPLYLSNNAGTAAITGNNTAAGSGLYGHSVNGYGVEANSNSSYALYATASGAPAAVYANNTGTDGVNATSTASGGNGVVGTADNGGSAYGVWGKSAAGRGVVGTGAAYGTYGASYSAGGTGAFAGGSNSVATPNTALEINGGAIKVSGSVTPAYTFTISVVSGACVSLNHPLLSGPNALVFATPFQDTLTAPATDIYVLYNTGVWYLCTKSFFSIGMKYNILVISQ